MAYQGNNKVLIVCTTDSMIWNFLIPHIKWMIEHGFIVECACSRTGFYFDELVNKYDIKLYEIHFERNPFRFENIGAYKALSRLIKEKNYGLIYCHEPVGGAMGRLAGKRHRKYTLYIAHGFHFFTGAPLKHWILYFSFEYFLGFLTDCLVTICNEDFEHSKKIHAKSHYYIPGIGVDFNKYNIQNKDQIASELRRELGFKDDDVIILSVGELSVRKNHISIIKAMNELQNPKIKLVICGEGDEYEHLVFKVNEYGLKDRVVFLGFRKDIPRILCLGDIFVFPSKWEGLGLAGIEALYSGLPILGSNRQGIKDYVINNVSGYLFEPNDYKQLANHILKLVNNPELRLQLSTEGRKVIERYSIKNSIRELKKIYINENILKEKQENKYEKTLYFERNNSIFTKEEE